MVTSTSTQLYADWPMAPERKTTNFWLQEGTSWPDVRLKVWKSWTMVKLYLEIGLGTVRWDIHAHNFIPFHGELNESLPGLLLLHISALLKSFQGFLVTHGFAQAVPVKSQEQSGDCEWPFAVFSLATALVGFHYAGTEQLGRTSSEPGIKLSWCKAQVLAWLSTCKSNKNLLSLTPHLQSCINHCISWAAQRDREVLCFPLWPNQLPLHLSLSMPPLQLIGAMFSCQSRCKIQPVKAERLLRRWKMRLGEVRDAAKEAERSGEGNSICWPKPRQSRCGREAVKGQHSLQWVRAGRILGMGIFKWSTAKQCREH